eukprot:TRINITY_DN594_c2_g1_i1.p1 TRINITY_DN594_c2_g1~~TRINITY_DN594_c2_g1_i1.p1  ORF type:complete len:462 (+),score=209.83 TRINITY_DN594_c2_g1_i1:121-1506(+)
MFSRFTRLAKHYRNPNQRNVRWITNLLIPDTKITTLNNGLRIATLGIKGGTTATIGIHIDAGSSYETPETNGTAHFLEHLTFKGTNKRKRQDIEIEIENMGAQLNAYTSRENTVYYAKTLKNDISPALNIIADIIQNSKLTEESIENERAVILEELKSIESNPYEVIFDHLHSVAYQESSLGFTILGPESNIKKINRENILDYINSHYIPSRMVVVGIGAVEHQQFVDVATSYFTNLSTNTKKVNKPKVEFVGSAVSHTDSSIKESHIALAFEGVGWTHPDYYKIALLQTLIGHWDHTTGVGVNTTSRLCETVARNNLAQKVSAFTTTYHKTSLFGVYAVCSPNTVFELCYEIIYNLTRCATDLSVNELEVAKRKLKNSLVVSLDGTTALFEEIGRQILTHNRRVPLFESFKQIDAITVNDIKQIVNTYIHDRDSALAAYGSVKEIPDYNYIRSWSNRKLL